MNDQLYCYVNLYNIVEHLKKKKIKTIYSMILINYYLLLKKMFRNIGNI